MPVRVLRHICRRLGEFGAVATVGPVITFIGAEAYNDDPVADVKPHRVVANFLEVGFDGSSRDVESCGNFRYPIVVGQGIQHVPELASGYLSPFDLGKVRPARNAVTELFEQVRRSWTRTGNDDTGKLPLRAGTSLTRCTARSGSSWHLAYPRVALA